LDAYCKQKYQFQQLLLSFSSAARLALFGFGFVSLLFIVHSFLPLMDKFIVRSSCDLRLARRLFGGGLRERVLPEHIRDYTALFLHIQ